MKVSIESSPPTLAQVQAAGKKMRTLMAVFAVVFIMALLALLSGANQGVAAVVLLYSAVRLTILFFSSAHRRFQPINLEEKKAVLDWAKTSSAIQRYVKQVTSQGRELVNEEYIAMQRFLQKENSTVGKEAKKK